MFEELYKQKEEIQNLIKYQKALGWKEYDNDGDLMQASITVVNVKWGYSVFRHGNDSVQHLYFSTILSEAVEWAVDRARKEIADHELKQVERERRPE